MYSFPELNTCTVAVIGLGYVGLPLAVELAKQQSCARTGSLLRRKVIGYDINQNRLDELTRGFDRTNEIKLEELQSVKMLEFSSNEEDLIRADVFIVTVPTPVDCFKRPDLSLLEKASATVGEALKFRSKVQKSRRLSSTIPFVIYESTVYPGATEEVCVPILEKFSGLVMNKTFCCGYSPERINPGDKDHTLTNIIKITSGSSRDAANWVDDFYASVINVGTFKASTLKVAEAAKVIENTQRDLNIALMNELAIIFSKMNIDTLDVLEAAGTKWNFLRFRPGLVGGHCIGVDPYYLTHKSEELNYRPEVVLAGRRINDQMANWVVGRLVLDMAKREIMISHAKVLVLGLTFKENCPDTRNSRVLDLLQELKKYKMNITVVDPWLDFNEIKQQYGLHIHNDIPERERYSVVVVAVAHDKFKKLCLEDWRKLIKPNASIFDLKGITPRELYAMRL